MTDPCAYPAAGLFGREKDDWLEGSLSAVMQTFDEAEVYSGLEEKASHLLCFLINNHRGENMGFDSFQIAVNDWGAGQAGCPTRLAGIGRASRRFLTTIYQ